MTDGAYTRLNESWETIRWDNGEGSADWQALRTLLDAYQRAVEALAAATPYIEDSGDDAMAFENYDRVVEYCGYEEAVANVARAVLDEARKMGVPSV